MSTASYFPSPPEREAEPVTLITGGSTGIGRALAGHFAASGDVVFLVARNERQLERTAAELKEKWRSRILFLALDLSVAGAAPCLLAHIEDQGLYVRNLVNSAATGGEGAFARMRAAEVSGLVQLNISTTTELMHLCLPEMIRRGEGGILNISSLGGFFPMAEMALYCASKSYLISLTRALAEEVRGSGVGVSVIVPGPVESGFVSRSDSRLKRFMPILSTQMVARVGYEGFRAGQVVITPGFLGGFYRLIIRLLPFGFLTGLLRPFVKKRV